MTVGADMDRTWISQSVEETEAIAGEIAGMLRGGECIALHGDLGAGKTQFVRGVVRGLGGDGRAVSSPTYMLLHMYARRTDAKRQGNGPRLPVFHLDAYRVSGSEELEAIGFTELLGQGGVVLVEWPSRVPELLPPDTWQLELIPEGPTTRRIHLRTPEPRRP
jgi:tRNA threonylcarbamoyladenosine biosynthesis protein TsaE